MLPWGHPFCSYPHLALTDYGPFPLGLFRSTVEVLCMLRPVHACLSRPPYDDMTVVVGLIRM